MAISGLLICGLAFGDRTPYHVADHQQQGLEIGCLLRA